jgi:chromate transporter
MSPNYPTFGEAARFWLKLGFVSFGGPAGQIAILHSEIVERRRWLDERPFTDALNFCMLLPGPEALQLAIFLGWKFHGVRGGLVAGLGFIGPAILLLLALSWLYAQFGHLPAATGLLIGLKAAVLALVLQALVRIGRRALRTRLHMALAIAAFVALEILDVPFPLIVLVAGLTGLASAWRTPGDGQAETTARDERVTDGAAESTAQGVAGTTGSALHGIRAAAESAGQEIVAADGIEPSRATATAGRVALTGALLWLLPFLFVAVTLGPQSLWSRVYLFFTQAALVTFGGAYAVLGYVTEHLVGDLGWLTAQQTADGLALAETTPGPLIIVLQFMGFMAGWAQPAPLDPAAGAVLAALLAS